jgi:hypothetical protein
MAHFYNGEKAKQTKIHEKERKRGSTKEKNINYDNVN